MKKLFLFISIYFYSISQVCAQSDRMAIQLSGYAQVSDDALQPLWLQANEWGKFPQYDQSSFLMHANATYSIVDHSNFKLSTGIGGIINNDLGESFLHELYLKGRLWFLDFSIGKEAYSPTVYNDCLSSGLFITSSNARPLPKVSIGIFNYTPIGFTNNWVEVRGGISQGWLNDDRGQRGNSANEALLHEKFAYLRMGNVKVQPYFGLIHSAIFGGTRPNGTEIPIDFWATFTASGSSKIGGGEETNAAGAHMGLWDFGLYFPLKEWKAQFYYQKPFADGSGLKIYNGNNKDHIIGLLLNRSGKKILTSLSFELLKTDYQSGYGIPDPLYPEEAEKSGIVWMQHLDEYPTIEAFMDANFPMYTGDVTGWAEDDVWDFLITEYNQGHNYGGRDDYMNNGMYYSGWTYHGQSMGTPLYHTKATAQHYAPGWEMNNHVNFVNNRVNGIHIGLEGYVCRNMKYRLKGTLTQNYGSYGEEFIRRYSWDPSDNYLFDNKKNQNYLMGQVEWQWPNYDALMINASIGYDFGDLYNAIGGRLGIIYQPNINW